MSIFRDNLQTPIWGGWVTGPTLIGPEEFARAGYDYVGFDAQHSYLDDADIAAILRRLEHVPIATVVRLPNADPAPIGRVLDAGDVDECLALFTPDAEFWVYGRSFDGHDGIDTGDPARAGRLGDVGKQQPDRALADDRDVPAGQIGQLLAGVQDTRQRL